MTGTVGTGPGPVERLLTDRFYDGVRRRSYIALDFPSWPDALPLVQRLGAGVDGYKVGLELFHGDGARALGELRERGKRVFLDVKLHDIPNTVAGALRVISRHGVEMVNVHAQGGRRMLSAAREAVGNDTLLVGVTVLTSLAEEDLGELGFRHGAAPLVESLTRLCIDCGLDGVVTSGLELRALAAFVPPGFCRVVPGTRPPGGPSHDQARTVTPAAALAAGATHLVLGRAVTAADDPAAMLQQIWDGVIANGS